MSPRKRRNIFARPTARWPRRDDLEILTRTPSGRAKSYREKSTGKIWTQYELQKARNCGLSPAAAAKLRKVDGGIEALKIAKDNAIDITHHILRFADRHKADPRTVPSKLRFQQSFVTFARAYDIRQQQKRAQSPEVRRRERDQYRESYMELLRGRRKFRRKRRRSDIQLSLFPDYAGAAYDQMLDDFGWETIDDYDKS